MYILEELVHYLLYKRKPHLEDSELTLISLIFPTGNFKPTLTSVCEYRRPIIMTTKRTCIKKSKGSLQLRHASGLCQYSHDLTCVQCFT